MLKSILSSPQNSRFTEDLHMCCKPHELGKTYNRKIRPPVETEVGDVTFVSIQMVLRKTNAHVRHHLVVSPDAPIAPRAGVAHWIDMEGSHPDSLIENWGRKLDENQEISHPVGENRTPAMQQSLDGDAG